MYLVISDEEILRLTKYVWVFYLTSKKKYKNRPFCVTIPKGTLPKCQDKESYIDCTKVRSMRIDCFNDENFCGYLPDNIMGEIDNTIFDVLNLGKYIKYWPVNRSDT